MKKLLSILMVACLLSNTTFAAPNHTQEIAKTFNEFRYKMTVQVDPNTPNFKQKAMDEFKQRMVELQKNGITAIEIMDYMKANILDQNTRQDFDRLIGTMSEQEMSSEAAGNVAMQFMAGKYQQGASYSGGGSGMSIAGIIIGVVIVGVVTYIAYQHIHGPWKQHTVTQTNTETSTVTESCTDTNTDTDTNTETDDGCNNPNGNGFDNGNCYGH